jgi:hypothetical protein
MCSSSSSSSSIQEYAQHCLQQARAVIETDVVRVEHLLRQVGKQLKRLRDPDLEGLNSDMSATFCYEGCAGCVSLLCTVRVHVRGSVPATRL